MNLKKLWHVSLAALHSINIYTILLGKFSFEEKVDDNEFISVETEYPISAYYSAKQSLGPSPTYATV